MSAWSNRKQFLFTSVILGVFLVFAVSFLVSYFHKPPTCYDGKQNGDETGVDVGGSCPVADSNQTRGIVTLWSRPFLIADDVYSTVAYIENQNFATGIPKVKYRFRLYDEDNVIVSERTGETFIGPNQRSAIFETGIKTGNRVPTNVFFEFLDPPTWLVTDSKWSTAQLVVESQELTNVETSPRLSVVLKSRAVQTVTDIEVIVILYDEDDNAVTASKSFIPSIEPNQTQEVFFTWPEPFERPVVEREIIPRINIFASGNQ